MMRLFLLLLMSITLSATMSAQKTNWQKFQKAKQVENTYAKKQAANDERAAYLMDSTKIYYHKDGDSTIFLDVKIKYNANGTIKKLDNYIDFFGLFQFWTKRDNFYTIPNKLLLVSYTNIFGSEDGVDFLPLGRDSSFYDAKDRLTLTRTRNIDTKDLLSYTINKYKTNFNIADTSRTYSLKEDTGSIEPEKFTYNVIDTKGNIVSEVISEVDFGSGIFDFSSKKDNKYDAQNRITETAAAQYDTDGKVWLKESLSAFFYHPDGKANYATKLSDYNEATKKWAEKDSTIVIYDNKNNVAATNSYFYDAATKKYIIYSKYFFKYDANGNPTYSVNYEAEEPDPTNLVKALSALEWWSFYKDAVGTKELFSKDFQLITSNPMSDNQEVILKSNKDGNYILEAYDKNGKVVSRQIMANNEAVNIQLPVSGAYVLLLSDKNQKPLAMKKVVKN